MLILRVFFALLKNVGCFDLIYAYLFDFFGKIRKV